MLKSHHAINGAYYFGVLLFLNRIIHGEGSSSAISASMSLHAIDEHGEIIVSRRKKLHLQYISINMNHSGLRIYAIWHDRFGTGVIPTDSY